MILTYRPKSTTQCILQPSSPSLRACLSLRQLHLLQAMLTYYLTSALVPSRWSGRAKHATNMLHLNSSNYALRLVPLRPMVMNAVLEAWHLVWSAAVGLESICLLPANVLARPRYSLRWDCRGGDFRDFRCILEGVPLTGAPLSGGIR